MHFSSLERGKKTIITSVGEIPYKYLSNGKSAVKPNQCGREKGHPFPISSSNENNFHCRCSFFSLSISNRFDQLYAFVFCNGFNLANSSIILFDKWMCQCWVPYFVTNKPIYLK